MKSGFPQLVEHLTMLGIHRREETVLDNKPMVALTKTINYRSDNRNIKRLP